MINRLPWRKKLRNTAANNLDKINEVIDYINHSDISPVALSECGNGYDIVVGTASSVKALHMEGKAVQDGTPTPDNPVPIQVVRGRNMLDESGYFPYSTTVSNSYFKEFVVNDGSFPRITVEAGVTYTLSLDVESSVTPFNLSIGLGNGTYGVDIATIYNKSNGRHAITFTPTATQIETYGNVIALRVPRYATQETFTFTISNVQLELGTTPTPYVPYGHVGLEVHNSNDELVSVTPIPLPTKGFAASLPDGAADVLKIDSAGGYEWDVPVGEVDLGALDWSRVIPGGGTKYVFQSIAAIDATASSTNIVCANYVAKSPYILATEDGNGAAINNNRRVRIQDASYTDAAAFKAAMSGVMLYYELATPTTESGYIDLPDIPDGATVKISASVQIAFDMEWWVYDDVTDIIIALKGYTDWKVEV